MSFLGALTGSNATDAIKSGIEKNMGLLNSFDKRSNSIIENFGKKSIGDYTSAIGSFDPYVAAGKDATGLYSDALGLNGSEGNARATGAFQTGPGYRFALDQGTQAALRGASAAGMLNSGNTLTELTKFGQGLADQEYGSWLDRLNGLGAQGLQAASGQAGAYSNRAGGYRDYAGDRVGLAGSVLQGRMGLNNDMAQVQAQEAAQQGGLFGGLLKGGMGLLSKGLTGGLF